MPMSSTEISAYRKHLRELLDRIEKQTFFCAYPDDLIQEWPMKYSGAAVKKIANVKTLIKDMPYLVVQLYESKNNAK